MRNTLGNKTYINDISHYYVKTEAIESYKITLILHQISFKKVITFQKKLPFYLNIKHIYSMQVKVKLKIIWRLPKLIIFECIFKH